MSQDLSEGSVRRTTPRSRKVLSGIALVLACISILLTTVAVWTHQVAFNTERFTALTTSVLAEPALIDPLSARISTQVVNALDVETRIANRLPGPAQALAPALTQAIRDALEKRLQVALANPRIQTALVNTVSFMHERLMNLLRDKPDAVSVVDGYVQVEVFPVVGAALAELQAIGLIPPEVTLPDLSAPEAPDVLAQRLETALGVTLPDDFGTIQLMPAERLLAARSIVRAFDLLVVGMIVLSAVLVALALWLSGRRRRMVIYLGIGTIAAFLLARVAIGAIKDALISGIADKGIAGAVGSVVDATLADLRSVTSIVLIATAIIAVVAYFWGRPRWAVAVASQVGDAAGRAGSSAAAAGSAGIGAAAEARPTRDELDKTLRENRSMVERFGLAAIVFVVAWIGLGFEVALIGAALVGGFELVLHTISSSDDETAADPADD
jgi:hypothetical protein